VSRHDDGDGLSFEHGALFALARLLPFG
jgi:hypothetical protein